MADARPGPGSTVCVQYLLDDLPALVPSLVEIYSDAYVDRLIDPYFAVGRFVERLELNALPGWSAVVAWDGDTPVASMLGVPLCAGTAYWLGIDSDREGARRLVEDPDFFEEDGKRTVATIDLMVRHRWRRIGLGYRVHEAVLAQRKEPRAAGNVEHGNARLTARYARWGYRTVATKWSAQGDGPLLDMLVRDLPGDGSDASS